MELTIGIRLIPDQLTIDMAARMRDTLPYKWHSVSSVEDDLGLELIEFRARKDGVSRIADAARRAFVKLGSRRPYGTLERLIPRGPGIQWWSNPSGSTPLSAVCRMARDLEDAHGSGLAYVDPPHILVARTQPDAPTAIEFQAQRHAWHATKLELVKKNGQTRVLATLLFD